MKKLIIPIVVAFVLWFIMFAPLTTGKINFWGAMSISAIVLLTFTFCIEKKNLLKNIRFSWKDCAIGIGSAAILWGIFWLGNFFSTLIFPFAEGQIGGVYAMKEGNNFAIIALLLLLLIGPAEEIFWHGFVQQNLSTQFSWWLSIGLTTLIYTLVHLPSLNFMLIMAAMVCGLFWGILYYFNKNLLTVIISHALWDVSVFILFPIS